MAVLDDTCPVCGRKGFVGSEREIIGTKAVTVYKCHHCNSTWRVPDEPTQPAPNKSKKS